MDKFALLAGSTVIDTFTTSDDACNALKRLPEEVEIVLFNSRFFILKSAVHVGANPCFRPSDGTRDKGQSIF